MAKDSIIEPAWEITRRERREKRREKKRLRKQMLKGCEYSRSFLLPFSPGQRLTEPVMTWGAWGAWALVAGLAVADAIRSGEVHQSIIYTHDHFGWALLVIGFLLMAIIMIDLVSYRPRLLEQSSASAEGFFESIAELSPTLEEQVGAVGGAEPTSWQEVKKLEENLLSEANEFGVFDLMKMRVTLRVLQRIAALVASLALVGYGLSTITHGGLLSGGSVSEGAGLPEHVYFTLVAFFTGFGDIGVVHDAVGFGYLAVVVGVYTGVVYFILTDVVAIQGELRLNMRAAAETLALQKSDL